MFSAPHELSPSLSTKAGSRGSSARPASTSEAYNNAESTFVTPNCARPGSSAACNDATEFGFFPVSDDNSSWLARIVSNEPTCASLSGRTTDAFLSYTPNRL